MLSFLTKWKGENKIENKIENLSELETGDILLFNGQGYWFSYVIEWANWSEFSHVGIVLKDPTYLDPKLKGYYMLESGTERCPDAIEHTVHFGVQVVNLEKILSAYTGHVYARKLNVSSEKREEFKDVLKNVWKDIQDLPYDNDIWDLFRIEFGFNWGDMSRMNKFYCSALVTYIYEKFQLLVKDIPWDLIKPKDYDEEGKIDNLLKDEYSLHPKITMIN